MKKAVLFLIMTFCITGCSIQKIEEQTDAEKFAIEYNISKNNPFHYISIEKSLTIFTEGNGMVFLGNPDEEWSRLSAKVLNEALKKTKVEKVSYINLKIARKKQPQKYKNLIKKITPALKEDETLKTPALFFIRDGKIVSYSLDYEKITKGNEEGFTAKERKKLQEKYIELIKKYQKKEAS